MLESPGVVFTWEAIKSVLLVFIAGGVGWLCRTILEMREGFHDLKVEVKGVDGKNGLKSKVEALLKQVKAIDDRHAKLDAITEYERQQHPGPDRRKEARRLRDIIRENDSGETA
jgi:hypothetical protein